MPKKQYLVNLTEEEHSALTALRKKGKVAARTLARAPILRLADEGKQDADIASALGVGLSTVERTRKKYVEGGLDQALKERPRPGVKRKLDDKQEAYLIALACSTPAGSQVTWTMQLLADRLVELGVVDAISDETVRRPLKKRAQALAKAAVVHSYRRQ